MVPRVTGVRPVTKARHRNYPVFDGTLAFIKPIQKNLFAGGGNAAPLGSSAGEENHNNQFPICSGRVAAGSEGLLLGPYFRPELSSLVSGAMDVRKELL